MKCRKCKLSDLCPSHHQSVQLRLAIERFLKDKKLPLTSLKNKKYQYIFCNINLDPLHLYQGVYLSFCSLNFSNYISTQKVQIYAHFVKFLHQTNNNLLKQNAIHQIFHNCCNMTKLLKNNLLLQCLSDRLHLLNISQILLTILSFNCAIITLSFINFLTM